jgi:hypothetical protein
MLGKGVANLSVISKFREKVLTHISNNMEDSQFNQLCNYLLELNWLREMGKPEPQQEAKVY